MYPDKTFWTPISKAKKGNIVNCHELGLKTIAKVKKICYGYEITFTDGTTDSFFPHDRLDIIHI